MTDESIQTNQDAQLSAGFKDGLPSHLKDVLSLTTNDQDNAPKVRTIYLVDGKVIFGILLLETTDSFLVGAPTRLVRNGVAGDIEIDPMYESMTIRILKASTALVTHLSSKYEFLYLDYLLSEGSKILPEYINSDRVEYIQGKLKTITFGSLGMIPDNIQEDMKESKSVFIPQLSSEKVAIH